MTSSFLAVVCLRGSWQPGRFDKAFKKLTTYLRPGGMLLLNDAEGPSDNDHFLYYYVLLVLVPS